MSAYCKNCFRTYSAEKSAIRHQKTCSIFVCCFCREEVSGVKGKKGYDWNRNQHEKTCK